MHAGSNPNLHKISKPTTSLAIVLIQGVALVGLLCRSPTVFCSIVGLEAFSFDYVVKWPVSLILSKKVRITFFVLWTAALWSIFTNMPLESVVMIYQGLFCDIHNNRRTQLIQPWTSRRNWSGHSIELYLLTTWSLRPLSLGQVKLKVSYFLV